MPAMIATLGAGFVSLIGQFVPVFKPLYDASFFTGSIVASIIYFTLVSKRSFVFSNAKERESLREGASASIEIAATTVTTSEEAKRS